jgi:hypothetical protein
MLMFSDFEWDNLCSTRVVDQCKGDGAQRYHGTPKVNFSTDIKICPVPNLCLLSEKDKSELWYSEPTKKTKGFMRLLLCGSNRADTDGGGKLNPKDKDVDKSKLRFPVELVLSEQDYQRYEGTNDPTMMAKLYAQCSSRSAAKAQARALHNEVEIKHYVVTKSRERKRRSVARFLGCTPRAVEAT